LPCDVSVRRMSRGRGGRVVEVCHQLDRGRDQGSRCCLNLHQRNHLIGALSSKKPSQGNGRFPVIAGSRPEGPGEIRRDGGPVIDQGRRCRRRGRYGHHCPPAIGDSMPPGLFGRWRISGKDMGRTGFHRGRDSRPWPSSRCQPVEDRRTTGPFPFYAVTRV
jgi:hypothetical protein